MDTNTQAGEGNTLELSTSVPNEISVSNPQSRDAEETQSHSNALPKSTTGFASDISGKFSASGLANWAKNLRINPNSNSQENATPGEAVKNPFSLLSNSFGKRSSPRIPVVEAPLDGPSLTSSGSQDGAFGNIAKGFLDTSKNAMKAVQLKARHLVSQNKRRYQVINEFCSFSLCVNAAGVGVRISQALPEWVHMSYCPCALLVFLLAQI